MKRYNIREMVNGWMVGDFDPAILKTKNFEVGYHTYKKNAPTQNHYHKTSTEINLVVKGDVEINGERFTSGDIFVLEPYMISISKFYKDTELVVIRDNSNPSDKYLVHE